LSIIAHDDDETELNWRRRFWESFILEFAKSEVCMRRTAACCHPVGKMAPREGRAAREGPDFLFDHAAEFLITQAALPQEKSFWVSLGIK